MLTNLFKTYLINCCNVINRFAHSAGLGLVDWRIGVRRLFIMWVRLVWWVWLVWIGIGIRIRAGIGIRIEIRIGIGDWD